MRRDPFKSKAPSPEHPAASRRRFLIGAATAAAGAAIAGFPMIAVARTPVSFRWQGAWSAKDIFHESCARR